MTGDRGHPQGSLNTVVDVPRLSSTVDDQVFLLQEIIKQARLQISKPVYHS